MGQFDNVNQPASGADKVTLSDLQVHDLYGGARVPNPHAAHVDLSSILNNKGAAAPAAPVERVTPVAAPAAPAQPVQVARPAIDSRPQVSAPAVADAAVRPPVESPVGSASEPRPPHPEASESTGAQVEGYLGGGAALVASIVAGTRLKSSVRAVEISKMDQLSAVTDPATLAAAKNQAGEVVQLVAAKGREAMADVDALALTKPHAFDEISELMPAKAPGKAAETLVFKQVSDASALTEDELAVTLRSDYLTSLERTLVKDFNMGNTSTVSAFRTRKPYIEGLGNNEYAAAEGLAKPLNDLESISGKLMHETTEGRLALGKSAGTEIATGAAVLGGAWLGTRLIDKAFYSQPQGLLTTGFDCALPFLVFTKMPPLVKLGAMIGIHEAVRLIDYETNKNKDN